MSAPRTLRARSTAAARIPFAVLTIALGLGGCYEHRLALRVPCVTQGWVASVRGAESGKVDLLFMVDNSNSMDEEQASLGTELPRMVRLLVTGDRTGDGPTADDFPPVESLHVGVVTSDMGVANFVVPTCTRAPQLGDDGLLRTTGTTALPDCMPVYPSFLEYQPGSTPLTPEQFGATFRCVATAGTGGCGFEQQLESALKALTPASSALRFYGGTTGHGDRENAGFLRPDSVIAIVLVTDEEDCSVASGFEAIFDQSVSSAYTGDLNLRCFNYPETQWPIQRYIDGLKALRPGRESTVVFAAIVGVPGDLIAAGAPDYDAILADPRMIPTVDGTGRSLVPSCNVPGRGLAQAPRRLVEVAQGFGRNGVVQSICQDSFTAALDAVVAKVADALDAVCLPEPLELDASGLIGCDVTATVPPPGTFAGQPTSCAELTGAEPTPRRTSADGSLDCVIVQRTAAGGTPTGDGWYYEDLSRATRGACAGGQRLAFTPRAVPPLGIAVSLECLEPLTHAGSGSGTGVQLGTLCTPDSPSPTANPCAPVGLLCEPASRTCQIRCAADADCPSSLACDRSGTVAFCRNPTCIE